MAIGMLSKIKKKEKGKKDVAVPRSGKGSLAAFLAKEGPKSPATTREIKHDTEDPSQKSNSGTISFDPQTFSSVPASSSSSSSSSSSVGFSQSTRNPSPRPLPRPRPATMLSHDKAIAQGDATIRGPYSPMTNEQRSDSFPPGSKLKTRPVTIVGRTNATLREPISSSAFTSSGGGGEGSDGSGRGSSRGGEASAEDGNKGESLGEPQEAANGSQEKVPTTAQQTHDSRSIRINASAQQPAPSARGAFTSAQQRRKVTSVPSNNNLKFVEKPVVPPRGTKPAIPSRPFVSATPATTSFSSSTSSSSLSGIVSPIGSRRAGPRPLPVTPPPKTARDDSTTNFWGSSNEDFSRLSVREKRRSRSMAPLPSRRAFSPPPTLTSASSSSFLLAQTQREQELPPKQPELSVNNFTVEPQNSQSLDPDDGTPRRRSASISHQNLTQSAPSFASASSSSALPLPPPSSLPPPPAPPAIQEPGSSSTDDTATTATTTPTPQEIEETQRKEEEQQRPFPKDPRAQVLREIIDTERTYNKHLDVIVNIWMKTMKTSGCEQLGLKPDFDFQTLFANVEQLSYINKELLASLDGLEDLPVEEQNVGERFLKFSDYLKMYLAYCNNQNKAIMFLNDNKSNSKLNNVLESIRQQPECEKLDIQSWLIKPMQRITKYPLLLRELIKQTEEQHPDFASLVKCHRKLSDVVAQINTTRQKTENFVYLSELQNSLEGGDSLHLLNSMRHVVKEDSFKKVKVDKTTVKGARLWLFNDVLLVAAPSTTGRVGLGKKWIPKTPVIPVSTVLVWDVPDSKDAKFAFSIVVRDTTGKYSVDKITVFASSAAEKDAWISQINDCVVSIPESLLLGPLNSETQAAVVDKFFAGKGSSLATMPITTTTPPSPPSTVTLVSAPATTATTSTITTPATAAPSPTTIPT